MNSSTPRTDALNLEVAKLPDSVQANRFFRLALQLERDGDDWRSLAHEAFLQLEYLHQRERKHSSTGAVLQRLSAKLGLPLDISPSATGGRA